MRASLLAPEAAERRLSIGLGGADLEVCRRLTTYRDPSPTTSARDARAMSHGGGIQERIPPLAVVRARSGFAVQERLPPVYRARPGRSLGRDGWVALAREDDAIWVGGQVVEVVAGSVAFPP